MRVEQWEFEVKTSQLTQRNENIIRATFRDIDNSDLAIFTGLYQTQMNARLEITEQIKNSPFVKKVIFNNPATIVFWKDDTKTVVKAQDGEKYDEEKGLALCFMKKSLGNKGNYNNEIKRWIDET